MDDMLKVCLMHSGIEKKIDALCQKIDDRDANYHDRELASKESVRAAFNSAEKAAEKTELALKEYKLATNNWHITVKELMSVMVNKDDFQREVKILENQILDLREYRSRVEGRAVEKVETRGQTNWSTGLTVVTLISAANLLIMFIKLFIVK
jgi:hypothetical protein